MHLLTFIVNEYPQTYDLVSLMSLGISERFCTFRSMTSLIICCLQYEFLMAIFSDAADKLARIATLSLDCIFLI